MSTRYAIQYRGTNTVIQHFPEIHHLHKEKKASQTDTAVCTRRTRATTCHSLNKTPDVVQKCVNREPLCSWHALWKASLPECFLLDTCFVHFSCIYILLFFLFTKLCCLQISAAVPPGSCGSQFLCIFYSLFSVCLVRSIPTRTVKYINLVSYCLY